MTIWKFPLQIQDNQAVCMPSGSQVLTCQMQDGVPCMWALVNPIADRINRRFEIFGTGHPVDYQKRNYIATVQDSNLVWHIFENLAP